MLQYTSAILCLAVIYNIKVPYISQTNLSFLNPQIEHISVFNLPKIVNPFPPRRSFVILLCLMPGDFTHQGEASGWERVICPSLFLNPFPPSPAKTGPFVILLLNCDIFKTKACTVYTCSFVNVWCAHSCFQSTLI